MTDYAVKVSDRVVWTKWPYILLLSHVILSEFVRLEPLAYLQDLVLLLLNQVTQLDLFELPSFIRIVLVAFCWIVLFKVDVVRHTEDLFDVEFLLVDPGR